MGVPKTKINADFVMLQEKSRIIFLEKLALVQNEHKICGSVAEGGVFQGEFAREINRVFPDRTLYLFDTFSGFDERDLATEKENSYSKYGVNHLNITSVDLVMQKLPHPKKVIIKKGFFPETVKGVSDSFCFVNLDFDLHDPTLAALEFFYPLMEAGGVILVHDYFNSGYLGVKAAIEKFMIKANDLQLFPIGDGISIGIIKV